MSDQTGIQWADATWNPVVGCTPVSPGCLNCYAATMSKRLGAMGQARYVGLTVRRGENDLDAGGVGRDVFNGTVRTVPEALTIPLKWRKPRRIFVNSMSDLFHEAVPFEFIDRVFAVMAVCPQHTFLVLTKRPERMRSYLTGTHSCGWSGKIATAARDLLGRTPLATWIDGKAETAYNAVSEHDGVLPNVWLGTSVEDQTRADERIWELLRCPAAVRFLSCEPLLGPVDISMWIGSRVEAPEETPDQPDALHWVIVGGESGRNSRPCCTGWVRYLVDQCRDANVPVFVKQLGKRPCVPMEEHTCSNWGMAIDELRADTPVGTVPLLLKHAKGGDPAEWPEDLRVREFPRC